MFYLLNWWLTNHQGVKHEYPNHIPWKSSCVIANIANSPICFVVKWPESEGSSSCSSWLYLAARRSSKPLEVIVAGLEDCLGGVGRGYRVISQRISWKIDNQWIGLREELQENPIFNGKNYGFRFQFSLKPIHWDKHGWTCWCLKPAKLVRASSRWIYPMVYGILGCVLHFASG